MSLTAIIILILLALILLVIEILFVPGMILGIISFIMIGAGVYFAYESHGAITGHLVLAGSVLVGGGLVIWAFKSNVWTRVGVNNVMDGRANVIDENNVKVGDKGVAVSRLAPMGKAMINEQLLEVVAYEGFLDQNSPIEVYRLHGNRIIVKKSEP
jgi:membrane-bound ClpP family serine protease